MPKSPKKRNKKYKSKAPPKKSEPPARITPNGLKIWEVMRESKVKGNYRDYVLFVGNRMLDVYGTYDVTRSDDGKPSKMIALVHKAKLAAVLGPEVGARFWHAKFGKRTNHGCHVYHARQRSTNVKDDT